MCFFTSKSARVKVAKEDIVCYKCMLKGDLSPVYPFQYRKGKITPIVALTKVWRQDFLDPFWMIGYGYHSYKTRRIAEHSGFSFHNIREFIIPKGTSYYSNRTQYVSERIIMIN